MDYKLLGALASVFMSILYMYNWLSPFIYVGIHVAAATAAFYYSIQWHLVQGKLYKPVTTPRQVSLASILLQKMMEKQAKVEEASRKVVISRSLDNAIQDIMDLAINDFILSWYTKLGQNQQRFVNSVQCDMWLMVEELGSRLSRVDFVKVITQEVIDLLHDHYRDIRFACRKDVVDKTEKPPTFVLHPWLRDEESERNYLRKLCDVLLICLLPPCYNRCHSIRHLLREIVTAAALKPMVDLICDPDYINLKLLSYLEYREKLSEDTRRTYTYAATYEDFVKKIEMCEDIEHLKQMRYNIISEIMHATTINNLKKAQGIKTAAKMHEKESSPKSTTKGELLKARNLKRYINQLTVAKSRCEKRIQALGGPDYKYYSGGNGGESLATSPLPGQKVLSFSVIMDLPQAREYFMKYLKKESQESLLGFWNAVEKLRVASKDKRHHVASEIYQQYVSSSSTAVKLDKATIKGMEIFLIGDKGPESFYEAQKQLYGIMEEKYYPSFIVSDIYHQCISSLEEEDNLDPLAMSSKDELFLESKDDIDPSESPAMFADESYHAQQKMQQLDEKLANKTQALQAIKSSQKPDEKTKKVEDDMDQEIEKIQEEKRKLEAHISRTQLWIDHQGTWMAQVHNAEVSQSGTDRLAPSFILVIYLRGSQPGAQELQNSSQGWVVSRSLDDFYALHEKLVQIGPWLKKKELPSVGMTFFKSIDAAFLEKAKKSLNEYLIEVMKDERMTQSEALYAFLTPSPECLLIPSTQKKSKFKLANLIKSLPNIRSSDAHSSDDEFLFLGDESTKEDHGRDSIAKPIYRLMNEVFELRGMFKWLRKSFISFVEISFGRSINRQLRETVDWVFSESMVIYYLNTFKDSMWPEGELAEASAPRTDDEKLTTRVEAKQKILENIPDALKNLVGEDNARRGTIKMFEALQDVRLNKQLFYNIVEVFMMELCPEVEKIRSRVDSQTSPTVSTTSTAVQT
ncbi:sorting nexin-25-like isoform X1 [Haliotis asinina]|uniref:sorting nexin-25-like isoform X1 n=1 Tax=Haliotis asinina TaxID=109174 RepID=UPI003531E552